MQDIKDLEYELGNDIYSVNSTDCWVTARSKLEYARDAAGDRTLSAHVALMRGVTDLPIFSVYPVLNELTHIIPPFILDPINVLGFYNPVTDFDSALGTFVREAENHGMLFENFVDQIRSEMRSLASYHNELFRTFALELMAIQESFVADTNAIRNYLSSPECN